MIDLNNTVLLVLFALLAAIGILLIGYYLLFLRTKPTPEWKIFLIQKYKELLAKDIEKKVFIIELDKLIEAGMKKKHNQQAGLGEILKQHKNKYNKQTLDQVWTGHRVRNKLVHDTDYDPSANELNTASISLKKFIAYLIEN